jgi:hypothetical protein
MNVRELEAGREIDALVAERIMRWTRETYWVATGRGPHEERSGLFGPGGIRDVDQFPCYSTEIAAAWEVVERMGECGREMRIYHFSVDDEKWYYSVEFLPRFANTHTMVKSAPLAICRSALQAIEAER